jgi:signal transduction histidine kinase
VEVCAHKEPRFRHEHPLRMPRPDGEVEVRYFTNTFQPMFDDGGQVSRVITTVLEVTREVRARKANAESSERLRVVLDEMPLGVRVRDASTGELLLSNKASVEILGPDFDSADHPAPSVRYLDAESGSDEEPTYQRVMRTGRPVRNRLVLVRRGDGRGDIVLRSSAVPIGVGRSLVLSVFEDVTEAHQHETERAQTLRFAEQFIGILGHDLRTPLNAMAMGVEVLRMRAAIGGTADVATLERLGRSTARMARMVDQLLDLTRARLAGGIPSDRQRVDLVRVVAAAVEELAAVHPARAVHCRLPTEMIAMCDGDRLAQVVSNLVGNAIEHGDPAEPVTVTLAEREPGSAELTVHNAGRPIPGELLPVLFEPFRRGRVESDGHASGLGLGLYISREIVVALGGALRVTSTTSEGTTFTVTLPRGM